MGTKKSQKLILTQVLFDREKEVLKAWTAKQLSSSTQIGDIVGATDLEKNSITFLRLFKLAISSENYMDFKSPAYKELTDFLNKFSLLMVSKGVNPSGTATFVFSLKEVLFEFVNAEKNVSAETLVSEVTIVDNIIDKLGLFTIESYSRGREEVIMRQYRDIQELNTPVIQVWNKILLVPLIGTLDSNRTQLVMEKLLNMLITTGSSFAIIDITGVNTVDTQVAQHLMKTVSAIRLLGCNSVITGISAPIAQTVVHLGIDLSAIATRAVMADGLLYALEITGQNVE